jgi:dTDP-L-rhamnose 4-epimerase
MTNGTVLVTGGAGFIGSHLADELLAHGYTVRALDNLSPQVHGSAAERPAYLDPRVDLVVGDVTDPRDVAAALNGADAAVHLAAAVGVGQSMYQAAHYTRTNNLGTAVLLEALAQHPVERLVVASSMSVYGEGMCRTEEGRPVTPAERSRRQLERRAWEITGENGSVLDPVPTPEHKAPMLSSLYALSKYDQERMSLMLGAAYGIPVVALRFFNVYGTRQSLSNPYTGVLAIFASRLMNGKPPLIFEDGGQRRDFVHVSDVARACRLSLEAEGLTGEVLNVGSGDARTVRDVAERLARVMDVAIEPSVTGEYRVGDIRHCFADIARARDLLGYRPAVDFDEGLRELAGWLESQEAEDRVEDAKRELLDRGLAL